MTIGPDKQNDIFGVGYDNKGVTAYQEFSDPKLKKETDEFISDLMKDSTINERELENKAYVFLNKYKDSKLFPEIKQKLFLRLQKEIKDQRAALNASGSEADTLAADKISNLYVLANIVKNIVLQDDNLTIQEWKEQIYPPKTAPTASSSASADTAELDSVKAKFFAAPDLHLYGFDKKQESTSVLRKLDNRVFEIDVNPDKSGKFLNPKAAIDKNGEMLIIYANYFGENENENTYMDSKHLDENNLTEQKKDGIYNFYNKNDINNSISTFEVFSSVHTNKLLNDNFYFETPLKPQEKQEILNLLKTKEYVLIGISSSYDHIEVYNTKKQEVEVLKLQTTNNKTSFENLKKSIEKPEYTTVSDAVDAKFEKKDKQAEKTFEEKYGAKFKSRFAESDKLNKQFKDLMLRIQNGKLEKSEAEAALSIIEPFLDKAKQFDYEIGNFGLLRLTENSSLYKQINLFSTNIENLEKFRTNIRHYIPAQ